MRMKASLRVTVLSMFAAGAARAALSWEAVGVAAEGRAGAGAALGGASDDLFLNPAGPAWLDRSEAAFGYGALFAGLPGVSYRASALSAARPVGRRWTAGAAVSSFNADDLLAEEAAFVGMSVRTGALAWGAAGTYLKRDYGLGQDPRAALDPTFRRGSAKAAIGGDVGVQGAWGPFRAGASVQNVNRPDLGLAAEDRVPLKARAGLAWQGRRLTAAVDVLRTDGDQRRQTLLLAGAEARVAPALALRAGAANGRITAGLGFRWGTWGVDYAAALVQNLTADSAGSHRLAFRMAFGLPRPADPVASRPLPATKAVYRPTPAGRTKPKAGPPAQRKPGSPTRRLRPAR